MGWDYTRYTAKCKECGREGVCIRGEDDWFRSSTSWEGFKRAEPDATSVGRKKSDLRDFRPICACGSTEVEVGSVIL